MREQFENVFETKWYFNQRNALKRALRRGHLTIVASDMEIESPIKSEKSEKSKKLAPKMYASYPTVQHLMDQILLAHENNLEVCIYELLCGTCKMYFDLEDWSSDVFSTPMDYFNQFEKCLGQWLKTKYISYDGSFVRVLTSCEGKKNSLHVIVSPEAICGKFFNTLAGLKVEIDEFYKWLQDNGHIDVAKGVDLNVYSKNRLFRTLLSTKINADRYFEVFTDHTPSRLALEAKQYGDFFVSRESTVEYQMDLYRTILGMKQLSEIRREEKLRKIREQTTLSESDDDDDDDDDDESEAENSKREEYIPSTSKAVTLAKDTDIEKLVKDKFRGAFTVCMNDESNGIIPLRRNHPSMCEIHKRVHENDNAFVSVSDAGIFFRCHRGPKDGFITLAKVKNTSRILSKEEQKNIDQIMPDGKHDLYDFDVVKINSKYLPALDPSLRCIIVKSHMGTGKSQTVQDFINKNKLKRVLYITNRISDAQDRYTRLKQSGIGVDLYLNVDSNSWANEKAFVVNLDSLHRVYKKWRPELVVIDECESILKQFSSTLMDPDTRIVNIQRLDHFLRISKRVFFLDAFVTQRTLNFVNSFNFDKVTFLINNFKVPVNNYYMIPYKQFITTVVQMVVKDEKKLYIPVASKKKGDEIYEKLQRYHKMIKFYHADEDDRQKRDLPKVNEVWAKQDVVLVSPCITVGISFDIKDYFDAICIYLSSHSCCVRDLMQSHFRVRGTKTNDLYVGIYSNHPLKFKVLLTKDGIIAKQKKLAKKKISDLHEMDEQKRRGEQDYPLYDNVVPWLEETLAYNILEDNVSIAYQKETAVRYLKFIGYKPSYTVQEKIALLEEPCFSPEDRIVTNAVPFESIKCISDEEAEIINLRIREKCATAEEKATLKLYCLRQRLGSETQEEMVEYLYNYVNSEFMGSKYMARIQEFKTPEETILRMDHKQKLSLLLQNHSEQRAIIHKYCKLLGLDHCCDEKIIPRDLFSHTSHEEVMTDAKVFDLRVKTPKKVTDKHTITLIGRLFETYCGNKMKCCKERQHQRVDGKLVPITPFQSICPLFKVYDHILSIL